MGEISRKRNNLDYILNEVWVQYIELPQIKCNYPN
jgi:hypothetical protein